MGIVFKKIPIPDSPSDDLDDYIFSDCEYSVSEK